MLATLRQMPVNQGAHPNTEKDRGITYHMLEGRGRTGFNTAPSEQTDLFVFFKSEHSYRTHAYF